MTTIFDVLNRIVIGVYENTLVESEGALDIMRAFAQKELLIETQQRELNLQGRYVAELSKVVDTTAHELAEAQELIDCYVASMDNMVDELNTVYRNAAETERELDDTIARLSARIDDDNGSFLTPSDESIELI